MFYVITFRVFFQIFKKYFILKLDQRGVVQEVSLVTKKGIDTKNYEGVSIASNHIELNFFVRFFYEMIS